MTLQETTDPTFTPTDIRALRLAYHASQAEFAELIGIRQCTLSHWETGRTTPASKAHVRALERLQENLQRMDREATRD